MIYRIEIDLDGGGEVVVTTHHRDDNREVGRLTVFGGDGDGFELIKVFVETDFRRQGHATRMLNLANGVVPVHIGSQSLPEAARPWAAKMQLEMD